MVKGQPLRFVKGHNTGVGHRSLAERIRAYCKTDGGCWLWTGAVRARYGAITINGKVERAHRASYAAFVGPIPERMLVLHKCDRPLCVNPAHLFLGTQSDNEADKVAKGRQAKGERNGLAVLGKEQVAAIRRYSATHSYQETADHFGVHKSTIADILNGRTWIHV